MKLTDEYAARASVRESEDASDDANDDKTIRQSRRADGAA